MAWRDGLRQGSFRGAEFQIDDAQTQVGRRVALHEYPLRDKPYPEDLGKATRTFTVDCFVSGTDYATKRNALISACEAQGPGRLVHPMLGEMTVQVSGPVQVRESVGEGGVARFTLTFVEAGDITFAANVNTDPAVKVTSSASALTTASQSSFSSLFSVAGRPFVASSAIDALTGIAGLAQGWANKAQALTGSLTQPLFGYMNTLTGLKGSLTSLVDEPSSLASQLSGLVSGLSFLLPSTNGDQVNGWSDQLVRGAGDAGGSGLTSSAIGFASQTQANLATTGLSGGAGSFSGPAATNTAGTIQQAANLAASTALVRQTAIAEAAQAAVAMPYQSADQAQAARDTLAALIDSEMTLAGSDPGNGLPWQDDVWLALGALRRATVAAINATAATLPSLRSVTIALPTPALVLAHRLYDDPSWADDIVARNAVVNPLFVPAGAVTVLGAVNG